MVMTAFRTMDMGRLLGGWGQLPREYDPARFVLLGQMLGDFRVESLHVADHAVQETARLKILAGKFR